MSLAPEDCVNIALDECGYPHHIADIYEGSPAARVALEIYGETRDALLASGDWPFALREVALSTSGQTPPTPWAYEYLYPSDCLRLRYLRSGPLTGGVSSLDPQPQLFRPWNDTRPSTPIHAILCNLESAVLIYNGRVTDPATWESGFLAAFISALAEKFSFMFPQSPDTTKARIGMAQADKAEAIMTDDMSPPSTGVSAGGK